MHLKTGYGTATLRGHESRYTHRIAWEIANGPIPREMKVLHTCDNRRCCNPAHLFLGTQTDNMADMVAKGRSADKRGTKNGRAKLTPQDVASIQTDYARGNISQQALAARWNVSQAHISRILRGKAWHNT